MVGSRGRPLGYATFSDRSAISLRLLTHEDARPDVGFWRARIEAAVAYRDSLDIDATAYRLVHGEGDRLPGLIVDRYGEALVVQTLTQATDRLLSVLCNLLVDAVAPAGILARNDPRVRGLEGLDQAVELRYGRVPEEVEVREGAVRLFVDPWKGQKTGLFLDQRENRLAAARYARGRVLDGFSYTGAFALQVAPASDAVQAVDVAESAVAAVARHAAHNDAPLVEARAGNVFDTLRDHDRAGERFDTVVLDPPAFAKNRKAAERAMAGYKEINLRALRILEPGRHARDVELLVPCGRADVRAHPGGRGRRRAGRRSRRGAAPAGPRSPHAGLGAGDVVPEVLRAPEAVGAFGAVALEPGAPPSVQREPPMPRAIFVRDSARRIHGKSGRLPRYPVHRRVELRRRLSGLPQGLRRRRAGPGADAGDRPVRRRAAAARLRHERSARE